HGVVSLAATLLLASAAYSQTRQERIVLEDTVTPTGEGARAGRITYTIADLGTLGGTESFAYAINDRGEIVGLSRTAGDSSTHTFLYHDRTLTDLFPLNSENIQTIGPSGINRAGQIA